MGENIVERGRHLLPINRMMTGSQRIACWRFLNALEKEFSESHKRLAKLAPGSAKYWKNSASAMRLAIARLGVVHDVDGKPLIKDSGNNGNESINESAGDIGGGGGTIVDSTSQGRGDPGNVV